MPFAVGSLPRPEAEELHGFLVIIGARAVPHRYPLQGSDPCEGWVGVDDCEPVFYARPSLNLGLSKRDRVCASIYGINRFGVALEVWGEPELLSQ